jgi:hypothetical protein
VVDSVLVKQHLLSRPDDPLVVGRGFLSRDQMGGEQPLFGPRLPDVKIVDLTDAIHCTAPISVRNCSAMTGRPTLTTPLSNMDMNAPIMTV